MSYIAVTTVMILFIVRLLFKNLATYKVKNCILWAVVFKMLRDIYIKKNIFEGSITW